MYWKPSHLTSTALWVRTAMCILGRGILILLEDSVVTPKSLPVLSSNHDPLFPHPEVLNNPSPGLGLKMAFVPSTVPVVGGTLGEGSGGYGQQGAEDFLLPGKPEAPSSCAAVTSPETLLGSLLSHVQHSTDVPASQSKLIKCEELRSQVFL